MSMTALGPEQIRQKLYRFEEVGQRVASPEAITEEHIRFYRQKGYLAVENVYTAAEVAEAIAGLEHLVEGRNEEYKGLEYERGVKIEEVPPEKRRPLIRKVWKFTEHEARLKAMSTHPGLVAIARRLLGSDVMMIQDMALLKPPRVGSEKPWHQDNAYFRYEPMDLVLGTWTALDEATAENGCMHVIPGSHLKGPAPHHHDRDCQLNDEDVDVAHDVMIPLKPGGVLFFSGYMHHGTPPNRSERRRWALQFHYASVKCHMIEAERHAALFSDDRGYAGCNGAARQAMLKDRYL